jgi:hypothetical protein
MTDRLRALLAKATPGPWTVADETVIWTALHDPVETTYDIGYPVADVRRSKNILGGSRWPDGQPEANAALIAESINALPGLLAELDRLRDRADAAEADAMAARKRVRELIAGEA